MCSLAFDSSQLCAGIGKVLQVTCGLALCFMDLLNIDFVLFFYLMLLSIEVVSTFFLH